MGGRILSEKERRQLILTGDIHQIIWILGWPVAINLLINNLSRTIDTKMVGSLGADAVAAVGIAQHVIMFVAVPIIGLSTGAIAVTARFYGKNESKSTSHTISQIFLLTVIFVIVIKFIGIFYGKELLQLMGADENLLNLSKEYINTLFLGSFVLFSKFPLWGIFQGLGDTRTPLKLDIIYNILNVIGNYIFIFGLGAIPPFGIKGAALGNILANAVIIVLGISNLRRKPIFLMSNLISFFRVNFAIIKEILRVSVPAALHGMTYMASSAIIIAIMGRLVLGAQAVAAYSVAMVLFSFVLLPASAISTVSSFVAGINLGNRSLNRAIDSLKKCVLIASLLMCLAGLFTYYFAPSLINFFVNDFLVIEMGSEFLKILALVMPIHAIGTVLSDAKQGAGDSKTPFLIALWVGLVIRAPLAYHLSIYLEWQTAGIWAAIAITQVVSAIIHILKFKSVMIKRAASKE